VESCRFPLEQSNLSLCLVGKEFILLFIHDSSSFYIFLRHKAIADYLFQCGFEDALNAFKKDASMVRKLFVSTYLV